MGSFYFYSSLEGWVDLENYTEIVIYFYQHPTTVTKVKVFDPGQFPKIRKWIIENCSGEVIVKKETGAYKRWLKLYFELESDALAFRLYWSI